jgi:hypothetical protein
MSDAYIEGYTMLVYAEKISRRLRFVLDYIFGDVFTSRYSLTENREEFLGREGAKIAYSPEPVGGSFHIPASGLLEETGVRDIDPGLKNSRPVPVLFDMGRIKSSGAQSTGSQAPGSDRPEAEDTGLDFDLFSAVFYMISRYEEYLPFKPDRHGRFESSSSIAGRNGFLELPVVDLWLDDLRKRLEVSFEGISLRQGKFRFLPTCDIDLPYAFLHRSWARTFGAGLRTGRLDRAGRVLRKEVLKGSAADPFDTFSEIGEIHANLRPKMFFLTAPYGKYDKSISPRSRAFRDLVGYCAGFADIGIHPSYRSSGNLPALKKEAGLLGQMSGNRIDSCRQHFLRFRLPGTYRNYMEAGIKEEYSMGFASAAGFRAGTSKPFLFYDLLKEEQSSLRVIPFQVMDRTLKDYMRLSPTQAMEKMMQIAESVRSVGGTFVSIWHNDAFSDFAEWKGWKDVYLQLTGTLVS